ncbi:hypothetical protein Hanom_Chr16g01486141 [Helianthus anomalus]
MLHGDGVNAFRYSLKLNLFIILYNFIYLFEILDFNSLAFNISADNEIWILIVSPLPMIL